MAGVTPVLCTPLPLPAAWVMMYAPDTDIEFVRELPAGDVPKSCFVAVALMPSAGVTLP